MTRSYSAICAVSSSMRRFFTPMEIILVAFWIGQMISIGVKNRRIEELTAQIAEYERVIATSNDALEVYRSQAWLEQAAWLLELYGYDDDIYLPGGDA